MESLQQSLAQLSTKFAERMSRFEGELLKGTSTSPNISSLAEEYALFKTFVLDALRSLQEQISLLARTADELEIRSRRKILLFHGVPEEKSEDTISTVVKVVLKKLNLVEFQASDIKRCYRMGKNPTSGRKPRPILVKFDNIVVRNQVWYSKTNLKSSGITISEFLTKVRHELFMKARKQIGMSKCWTRDGFIYMVSSDGTKVRLDSAQDLANITPDMDVGRRVDPVITVKETTSVFPKTRRLAKK